MPLPRPLGSFLLCLAVLCLLPGVVQAEEAIPANTDEPIFLKLSSQGYAVEGNRSLGVYFNVDSERCRRYYGTKTAYEACTREIDLQGRQVTDGIRLNPALPGTWRWDDDHHLTFTPDGFWQAGVNYRAELDLDAMGVPGQVRLTGPDSRRTGIQISARPLKVQIGDLRFMQDPDDPARKLVTARLTTNYPVERGTLTPRIHFSLEERADSGFRGTGDDLAFEITYHNEASSSAALSVALSGLPDQDRYAWLSVAAGVVPLRGGHLSPEQALERVRIPSLRTWLEIDDVEAAIARDEDGAPLQIVTLGTNVKVRPRAVLAKTRLYLLPARHPVQESGDPEPYQWKGSSEVSPRILAQSEPLEVSLRETGSYATDFALSYRAPPGRYVLLVVDEGLTAFGGFSLAERYREVLRVPAHPHDIRIMQQGSILPLSGERRLSLHARGTDRLEVRVAHIDPDAVHHFVSQTRGDIRRAQFANWRFTEADIADLRTRSIPMVYEGPRRSQYASLDFRPYLRDGRKGLFVIEVRGYKDDQVVGAVERRFVLVSDLGLLVKRSADHTRRVYVVSFASGRPVAGARIDVLGRNGQVVYSRDTDPDGSLALPNLEGAPEDHAPVAIVAQRDADFAFIPFEQRDRALNLSRFEIGGNRPLADGLNAFLFSDRGIYRPGEAVHLGLVLKNSDWSALPEHLPLKVTITDPRGNAVLDQSLTFAMPGLQEVSLETRHGWLTGRYRAGLYLARDGEEGNLLGSTDFKVEEFQPDRLKLHTGFLLGEAEIVNPRGWVKPGTLSARIQVRNLYGTPARDRWATAHVRLGPARFQFQEFADYRFFDSTPAPPRTVEYDLPDQVTDHQGIADFPLRLTERAPASYAVSVEMRGFEAGSGRGVTAYDGIRVSPMDYAVGYRAQANLRWLPRGSEASAQVIAITPDLEPRALEGLRLTLARKTYVSTLVRRDDGSFAYTSVPRFDDLETRDLAIGAGGEELALPTGEIGDFLYRITDGAGRVVAEIPFGVTGPGQRAAGLNREAILDVKADKAEYAPGSEIVLQITAPYTGAGLITLESDRVVAHQWFRTERTDTIQRIRVPPDFLGKGYIQVAFLRDVQSPEIYLSPLSYAVLPFVATPAGRTVNIRLDTASEVKPGELLDITYSADHSGKVVIFAVDEGILQVAKYKTPDPVDFFLLNRALQVGTTQMLDLLMPEYSLVRDLSRSGGGAAALGGLLQQHLNPFRRKTLAPAVFWSGIRDVDTGERTLSWRVPGHFNGRLRLMAVAVSEDAVGAAEKVVSVRGDIVLTPNLPLFLAPGDEVEGSVTIANATRGGGPDAAFNLSLFPSPHLAVVRRPQGPVQIAPGSETTVAFRLRATDTLGPARLVLTATAGERTQSAEASLSVRPPVARSTRLTVGYSGQGQADLSLSTDFYPTLAARQFSLSALPTSYIAGLARYLDGYPYGCTEQLLSRSFPKLSLLGLPEFGIQASEARAALDDTVAMLRRRLTEDGGFSQWYGQRQAHGFITAYAVDFLTTARAAGIAVPEPLVRQALHQVRSQVNRRIRDLNDARVKAYGIYLLTRNGIVTTNEILHLLRYLNKHQAQVWPRDLTAAYLAASYQLLQQQDLAEATLAPFLASLSEYEMSYRSALWQDVWYNPFVKYAQAISLMARHFPRELAGLPRSVVFKLASFVREQRYNTLSASFGIQALRDYVRVAGTALENARWSVLLDGVALATASSSATAMVAEVPVTAEALAIEAEPRQPFFYTLSESGFLKAVPDHPVTEGLEVIRRYQTDDGLPLSGPVAMGDSIQAVLQIRAYGDRTLENIAIVELLPGGFELERESVGKGSTLRTVFTDRREDRVIAFASVTPASREFRYRLRAVNKGVFRVPPPYTESMYDITRKARGHGGIITVTDPGQ